MEALLFVYGFYSIIRIACLLLIYLGGGEITKEV